MGHRSPGAPVVRLTTRQVPTSFWTTANLSVGRREAEGHIGDGAFVSSFPASPPPPGQWGPSKGDDDLEEGVVYLINKITTNLGYLPGRLSGVLRFSNPLPNRGPKDLSRAAFLL